MQLEFLISRFTSSLTSSVRSKSSQRFVSDKMKRKFDILHTRSLYFTHSIHFSWQSNLMGNLLLSIQFSVGCTVILTDLNAYIYIVKKTNHHSTSLRGMLGILVGHGKCGNNFYFLKKSKCAFPQYKISLVRYKIMQSILYIEIDCWNTQLSISKLCNLFIHKMCFFVAD